VSGAAPWLVVKHGRTMEVTPTGKLVINNSLAIRDALLAGLGIGVLPRFYVHELVRAKRLRAVLGDHELPPAHAYAVYARQRHLSTKIRAFIEFLREHLTGAAWS
jgi:DNA-binding transcriptional LysR family regulator